MDGAEGTFMQDFEPGPDTSRAFRDALGKFATGVTVITAPGPCGITANSFSSVSLEPALVLWSLDKASTRFEVYHDCPHYAIHVMGVEQSDTAMGFAKSRSAFEGLNWHTGGHDVPLIENCLARFECTLEATHDAGDHLIQVGRVTRAQSRDGAPLIFAGGQFGRFNNGL
ncbi:MAG: flavin reductase family protein [Pseudomonadota bacterium]